MKTILSAFVMLAGAALMATVWPGGTGPAEAFQRAAPHLPATTSHVILTASKKQPDAKYRRTKVRFSTNEAPGTIIVDTRQKFLYYVEGPNQATRYGIGVGRDGFGWSGTVNVGRKAEWPDWRPPASMIARERARGNRIPSFVKGGVNNPLGARALYLYRNGRDTIYRIHGTNQPWTIGQNMSSGCIRMMNDDVKHLYSRADIGSKVVVIGPGNRHRGGDYEDRGVDILRTIFGG